MQALPASLRYFLAGFASPTKVPGPCAAAPAAVRQLRRLGGAAAWCAVRLRCALYTKALLRNMLIGVLCEVVNVVAQAR